MEIESCYKNILISMHGGILCHFNREDNELIPFITTNELTSMQLLAVAPRACVNFINSNIIIYYNYLNYYGCNWFHNYYQYPIINFEKFNL
jgi:hypothetical protein